MSASALGGAAALQVRSAQRIKIFDGSLNNCCKLRLTHMDSYLQALKKFTSGSQGSSGSGGTQTQLISMAMAEATKLFDKSGGGVSGNKQDAVNGAAMTVMKLLVQSKLSGAVGGGNSGGLGGLMSLVGDLSLYLYSFDMDPRLQNSYNLNMPIECLRKINGPLYVKWILYVLDSIQVNEIIVVEDIYESVF